MKMVVDDGKGDVSSMWMGAQYLLGFVRIGIRLGVIVFCPQLFDGDVRLLHHFTSTRNHK